MNQPNQNQQVQIKATDEKLKGEYSNAMQILHTKEEFVLDFLNIFPPTGTLNSRTFQTNDKSHGRKSKKV